MTGTCSVRPKLKPEGTLYNAQNSYILPDARHPYPIHCNMCKQELYIPSSM
jgi:hypothetical protein